MALTPRLELRQTQTLVMTPQLQQAIKLLQLSNLELTQYVEQELQRNPLLEREDGDGEAADLDGGASALAELEAPSGTAEEFRRIELADEQVTPQAESAIDVDYDNVWTSDGPASEWGRGGSFDDREPDLEESYSGAVSLRDHLIQQLNVEFPAPADRLIGLHLIDMLDEAGYLAGEIAQVAATLECEEARVAEVLRRLQQFDPTGIFARSLSECLAIQLRERDRLDPAMEALLAHLDLLGRRDVAALQKICGVDADDIVDMLNEIRQLNPKPAHAFDHEVAQPVTPDILMRPGPGGGWTVELNADTLPRVLVNNRYYSTVARGARTREERIYLADCLQSANWLVRSLHQRATTILKVAGEIVLQQQAFFLHGVEHLRPLVLRDIAGAVEMHESTVSRVTSNKFIATPRGIYELKYFFTTAIASTSGGEAHSAESVRHRLKALIDAETPDQVLSDDSLVATLRAEGIGIARRTVAKYREGMGIPSSVQRKRLKSSAF